VTATGAAVLLASGFGDDVSGGGLFAIEASRAQRIDRIATKGLAFDGKRLARILRSVAEAAELAEVVIYDARGVLHYLRLDGATSPKDVAWDGENLAVVSSWNNSVQWFSPGGKAVREIRFPGPIDCWHLNCLTRHEDVWYATMFGAFRTHRAWLPAMRKGEGKIVELETGRPVVEGLTAPHSPRWVDGMWLVCNSQERELLASDPDTGRIIRRVDCDGWTRGLAYDDDFFYVGACGRRATAESFGHAWVVVVDRDTWQPVEQIEVPAQEIYDLTLVSPEIVDGLRRGFDVNPLRTAEFRQLRVMTELGCDQPRTLWPSGDPLPWGEFRFRVEGELPEVCCAGDLIELPVRVTNRSASFFTSAAPAPVYVSYKWLDPASGAFVEERRASRTWLPRTIFPNETVEVTARIVAPSRPGAVRLRVTLVQEGVSWFDDHDPSGALEGHVEIGAALAPPLDDSPILI